MKENFMAEQFSRTQMLLGYDAVATLHASRVIVFGVGGVGGFVTEALVRAGVGAIDIVDADNVALSNINRQIIALHSTVGRAKVDVMAERIHDINPNCNVTAHQTFFLPENASRFDFTKYDYVIDAVDTVTAKIAIIECAKKSNTNVISSMGTGNKLDPTQFHIADISKTSVCPLARVMRHELKKRNIKDVKVLYSTEQPVATPKITTPYITQLNQNDATQINKRTKPVPASISFVPSVAGLIIASEVIRSLVAFTTGDRDVARHKSEN